MNGLKVLIFLRVHKIGFKKLRLLFVSPEWGRGGGNPRGIDIEACSLEDNFAVRDLA